MWKPSIQKQSKQNNPRVRNPRVKCKKETFDAYDSSAEQYAAGALSSSLSHEYCTPRPVGPRRVEY